MGLSGVMAFALISFIALSSAVVMILDLTGSIITIYKAEDIKHQVMIDQEDSKITILLVSVSSNILDVTLVNSGSLPLWDFQQFGVVVKYYANVNGNETLSVSNYNYSASPTAYQWTSENNIINPGSLDNIEIVLPYPPYKGTKATIVISTNYGSLAVWRGTL
ncbi:MAG: flagellar protein FlaF [Candidatus Aramenus sulfurataquae]|jgi:flagellar protein FlaF|uniref:Flagellar protein FlaF n=2 Tax=Candidatus Aramenus sulfurataquae TaxID=1326980 RepID=W7L4N4_9CREN|nr:MAG: flagellar protein FlaF [Candidatus Aramenus sulfurataquae]